MSDEIQRIGTFRWSAERPFSGLCEPEIEWSTDDDIIGGLIDGQPVYVGDVAARDAVIRRLLDGWKPRAAEPQNVREWFRYRGTTTEYALMTDAERAALEKIE